MLGDEPGSVDRDDQPAQTRRRPLENTRDRRLAPINALIASIDVNVPAAVTIRGFNHWVVVNGYLIDPPAEAWSRQPYTIQGLYVTDPLQTDAIKRHKLVPLRQWKGPYFASMDCGVHQDEHPLVVGSDMALRDPSEIQPIAIAVLGRLSQSPTWNYALSESTHGESPTLVQHLDRDDEFYYLVTVTKRRGITGAPRDQRRRDRAARGRGHPGGRHGVAGVRRSDRRPRRRGKAAVGAELRNLPADTDRTPSGARLEIVPAIDDTLSPVLAGDDPRSAALHPR